MWCLPSPATSIRRQLSLRYVSSLHSLVPHSFQGKVGVNCDAPRPPHPQLVLGSNQVSDILVFPIMTPSPMQRRDPSHSLKLYWYQSLLFNDFLLEFKPNLYSVSHQLLLCEHRQVTSLSFRVSLSVNWGWWLPWGLNEKIDIKC